MQYVGAGADISAETRLNVYIRLRERCALAGSLRERRLASIYLAFCRACVRPFGAARDRLSGERIPRTVKGAPMMLLLRLVALAGAGALAHEVHVLGVAGPVVADQADLETRKGTL